MHLRFTLSPSLLCLALGTLPIASGGPPRLDRYGDPLPEGAVFRVGTTRLRHKNQVTPPFKDVLISPDGKFVFSSASVEDEVCTWQTATGRDVRRLPFRTPGLPISLSADGSLLAIVEIDDIHLYKADSDRLKRTINLSPLMLSQTHLLSFSRDGKILTAFHRGAQPDTHLISRSETATGKVIGSCKTGADVPVALSTDARLAATLREKDHTIALWESASGKKVREWKAAEAIGLSQRRLTFSPDGRYIAAAGVDAVIRVYETASGKEVRSWKGRTRNDKSGEIYRAVVGWLAFAADGKMLASVDCDNLLRLWDWKTGRELRCFEGVYGPVAFSADGRILAAGGSDARIRLWDTATGRDLCPFVDPGATTEVAFSPDGRVLAVGSDRGLSHLLDAADGRELKEVPGYRFCAFSPDGGDLLALRQKGERLGPLCLLDARTGKERSRLPDTNEYDRLGGWSPDGKILATTNLQNLPVRVWDTAAGKKLQEFRGKSEWWFNVGCSPDARTAAIADKEDSTIRLMATDTGKELRKLAGYSTQVQYNAERPNYRIKATTFLAPTFAPNGKAMLAACDRNSFGLWDVSSGQRSVRWNCAELLPVKPTFSPDSKWLILPDPHGNPCLVDAATGRVRLRLTWKGEDLHFLVNSVNGAFSADGRLLAAAYDPHTLVLWEVATGRPVCTLSGHGRGLLRRMIFSPDNRRLATVAEDGTALVWDAIGLLPDGRLPARKLTAAQTGQAWKDLADADAAKGHRALWSLVADPERALPLLREQLRPTPGVDLRRLTRLTADLDSDDFSVRDTSTRELKKLGESARPALRAALKDKPSLELRRRAQALLDDLDAAVLSAESLRVIRAVAVLEHIASADAQKLLDSLANGAPGARRTQEAAAALARLRSRRGQP